MPKQVTARAPKECVASSHIPSGWVIQGDGEIAFSGGHESQPVGNPRDDGFIMHLSLIALRMRRVSGLKYALDLVAFVHLFR